jgi:hypothetical protein
MTTTASPSELVKDVYTRPKRGKLTLVRKTEMLWDQDKTAKPATTTVTPSQAKITIASPIIVNKLKTKIISNKWTRNQEEEVPNVSKLSKALEKTPALSTKELCKFFTKTGKCDKGDKCPFLHDKSQVPVCKFFLQGRCHKDESQCPYRHVMDDKSNSTSTSNVPVCQKFLQGLCINERCPFLHVKQNKRKRIDEENNEQNDSDDENDDENDENEMKRPRNISSSTSIIPHFF